MSRKKSMGLWAAISVGVGGMIGAGIFSILGTACQIAGNAVYISFILAGVIALLSTYSYAKLGVKYPSLGGPVEFLVRGFGDGIFSGGISIVLWIGYIIALALYARAFAAYSLTFFIDAPHYWLNISATGIILLFTAVNFIGSKAVGRSELFIVAIKVGVLILFAALGFFFIKPQLLSTVYFPSVNNIFYATAVLFLAYEGFGLITNTAEDMKDPANTLPKALYLSVIIVIAIYIAVSTAVVGNLSLPEIIKAKDYALAEATKPFLGLIGFKIMAVAALFSTSSAINATLYGGANVSYMIAKEGELPEFFERKVWGKGIEGLFITAGLVILFANLFDIGKIAMLGSASFLLIYTAVNIGHLRLYKETGANPVLIWLSILGSLSVFIVLIYYLLNHSILTIVILSIVLLLSFVVELIYRRATKRSLKTRRCE
jgi:amino acid transporter